jgi:membrane-associated phospholipid phosphatase
VSRERGFDCLRGTFVRIVIAQSAIALLVCGVAARPVGAQIEPAPSSVGTATGVPAARPSETASAEGPTPSRGTATSDPAFATSFLHDVLGDYKHYFSKETAIWLGGGGLAALAVHPADDDIARHVQENHPDELIGGNTYGSQWLHIPVAMAVWGIGSLAGSDRFAETGRDLLRAQISVVSWTYAIKYTANRTRPNGDPRGFPSGHASTSFATAAVLQEQFGWKVGVPAFLAAAYTGASRVVANQHWTSDVIFGAAVGMASGRTVTLHLRDNRFTLAPMPVPGGAGVLVTALRQ